MGLRVGWYEGGKTMNDHAAVYAGTYDPWTNGHSHVLMQAAPLFAKITLAIGVNPAKRPMFDLDTRLAFLKDVADEYPNVDVGCFENIYTANYAESQGAKYIVRGIRNINDFEAELSIAQINLKINPRIRTVFFMADRAYADISSSNVKAMIGYEGWEELVKQYIPSSMWNRFIRSVHART